jgi:glycosyltransferase involved in cell wall biosynthesis
MDVCLLCYALTDYTRYIFPLKLHEYLAAGRPVVGADLRTLRDFEHVVAIVRDPGQWVSAIEGALSPAERTPERVEERQRVARAYDWNALTERIAAALCDRLGEDFTTRLAAAGEQARGYQP